MLQYALIFFIIAIIGRCRALGMSYACLSMLETGVPL